MPTEILTVALLLSLWVAFGSVLLAVVDGLGPNPQRRLLIGVALLAGGALVFARRAMVSAQLQQRPWLVIPVAATLLGVIAIDGLVGGPYVAVSLTSIGVAVVAARARTVWMCAGVLSAGYTCGVLLEYTPSQLADEGQLSAAIGAVVSYPVAAALLLGLRRRFTEFVADVELTLEEIRAGAPAQSPALEQALRARPIALLPAPPPTPLTAGECNVVEGLATGLTAKQLALQGGVSINTIRTHIRNAKRKTGARTLRELAAMPAHPGWVDGGFREE